QVRRAGGVPVSLAETLAPEFHRRGESLFSPDRFHPNSQGYELAAGLLLPAVCVALGVWDEVPEEDSVPQGAEEAAAALAEVESAAGVTAQPAVAGGDGVGAGVDDGEAASPGGEADTR